MSKSKPLPRRLPRPPEPGRVVLYVRLDEAARERLHAIAYRRSLPVAALVRAALDPMVTGSVADEALAAFYAAGSPPPRHGRRSEGAMQS